jgi:hypothetical protein
MRHPKEMGDKGGGISEDAGQRAPSGSVHTPTGAQCNLVSVPEQLAASRALWAAYQAAGQSGVYMPHALDAK